jgi:dTDP-glucose pyrophosphorylase
MKKIHVLIPMAGLGSRFRTNGFYNIKPLIPVNGKTFIEWSIDSVDFNNIKIQFIFIILEEHKNLLENHLKEIKPECIIITIPSVTRGAVETALAAESIINNDIPLIITNSDQIFEWNKERYMNYLLTTNQDANVVVINANDDKFSYIELDSNGNGIRLTEKEVISDNALVGIHFWKKGSYFVSSGKELIEKNIRSKNEFYISLTYNLLIASGIKVSSYMLTDTDKYLSVGTPEQLYNYLNYKNLDMKLYRLKDFTRGWFIGDFEPSILKNTGIELGFMTHKKGEIIKFHYHEHCIEINLLVKGRVLNCGKIIEQGDIFVFDKNSPACPIFLEDSEIVCFKSKPSNTDKVIM